MVYALRELGCDYVFDTDFAADLPIMDEGSEILTRLTRYLDGDKSVRLPILTSCDEYWIQAELSDVRSNTTGHCYLEFIQKDPRSNSLVAKARGMIWNNIYRLLMVISVGDNLSPTHFPPLLASV